VGERMWAEATTMGDLLRRAALDHADRELVAFDDERDTFAQFQARVDRISQALVASGVRPREHVGLLMQNSIDYLATVYAVTTIGAVAVPISTRYRTEELQHVLRDSDIVMLVTSDRGREHVDLPALVARTLPELAGADARALQLVACPRLRSIVLDGDPRPGFLPSGELLAGAVSVDAAEVARIASGVRLRDTALLLYTSGTTANPKGCVLTHEAVVRNSLAFARVKFDLSPDDRMWNPLPLFHMATLLPFAACVSAGTAFLGTQHFDATVALEVLERDRVTIAYPAFETIWKQVLSHPRFGTADLTALRVVMNTGTSTALREMQDRVPWASQVTAYGSTEGAGSCSYNHPSDPLEDRMSTSGTPFPGVRVKAVDPLTLQDRAPGEVGELVFAGYSLFEGYYGDPVKTAEVMTADGWFRSGDLGSVDDRGQVTFRGRIKDMLKIGGENVAALEIENFLVSHPDVLIVAVVGVPDDHYGEVAAAFVELRPGAQADAEELVAYCRGRIASFKVPRQVHFVSTWPMSGTKIKKHVLREGLVAAALTE
jgi:fatty-acyl-CoA synthase